MIVTDKLSTESFHAFIDEQLTDEQYVQVEAQLDELPEKIEEIQQCHIVNERLREVFDPIVEEPIPEDLYELAIYGLENQRLDEEITEQEYDPVSYLELEDDIAAIDAMDDDFPEELEGDSLVDDTDVADLEVLAQTEHLSDFDIDELRSDPSNLIPDIFDEPEHEETLDDVETPVGLEASYDIDPADDLLESIDELTIELEKTHQSKSQEQELQQEHIQEQQDVIALSQEAELSDDSSLAAEEEFADNLELTPVESEEEALLETFEAEHPEQEEIVDEPSMSAQEQVLETLETEELTLEPLEQPAEAAFIQETEAPDMEPVAEPVNESKPSRPRNLRAGQSATETSPQEFVSEQSAVQNELFEPQLDDVDSQQGIEFESTAIGTANSDFQLQQSPSREEGLPDDLVAEFFSEKKGADFEVNEVVKQFEEVSQDFASVSDDHLFDDGPVAGLKYQLQEFLDTGRARLEQFKNIFHQKKSELLGKFGGGLTTDFNKSPFEDSDFAQFPSKAHANAPDLSAFANITKETSAGSAEFASDFTVGTATNESPVLVNESKAENQPDQVMGMDSSDFFQDFDDAAEINKDKQQNLSATKNSHAYNKSIEVDSSTEFGAPVTPEFDFDMNMDEVSNNGNIVSKFGDTLRQYKQKIADIRANQTEFGEETSTFDSYKNTATKALSNIQFKGNPAITAGVALVVGIVVVSLVLSIAGNSGNSISNDRIDKLAIDTHLLNTQFNSKLVADADSAIIEKLQWFSVRVGRQIRLADIQVEDFKFKKVTVLPTMASFAAANIFENKAGQRMTLIAIPDVESTSQSPLSCRIPAEVDGLCAWVKDSVRYVVVANLSLSRVRSFSEQIIEKL